MPLTIPLSDDAEPDASLQWSIAKGIYTDISFRGMIHAASDTAALLCCWPGRSQPH